MLNRLVSQSDLNVGFNGRPIYLAERGGSQVHRHHDVAENDAQYVFEAVGVDQAAVRFGDRPQQGLQPFRIGDVGMRSDDTNRVAFVVAGGLSASHDPAVGAVIVAKPEFTRVDRRLAAQVPLISHRESITILGVHSHVEQLARTEVRHRRNAQHFVPAVRNEGAMVQQVVIPNTVLATFNSQLPALLARPQLVEKQVTRGSVADRDGDGFAHPEKLKFGPFRLEPFQLQAEFFGMRLPGLEHLAENRLGPHP